MGILGKGFTQFFRDLFIGIFLIAILLFVAALMNNSGVPQKRQNTPTNPVSKNLLTFDQRSTLSDLLDQQRQLKEQEIDLHYSQITFDDKTKKLRGLALQLTDQMGSITAFDSPDVSEEPIVVDLDLFLNQEN